MGRKCSQHIRDRAPGEDRATQRHMTQREDMQRDIHEYRDHWSKQEGMTKPGRSSREKEGDRGARDTAGSLRGPEL